MLNALLDWFVYGIYKKRFVLTQREEEKGCPVAFFWIEVTGELLSKEEEG